jgi:hypothetical protein
MVMVKGEGALAAVYCVWIEARSNAFGTGPQTER